MRPIQRSGVAGSTGAGEAALVISGRRAAVDDQLREVAAARGERQCVVLRTGGRRSGASKRLVAELLDARVSTVVVPSLLTLHPSAPNALAMAAALMTSGVALVSLSDAWLTSVDPPTVAAVASFLMSDERRRASAHGRNAIALVRKTGKRIGRPSKPLPVPVEQARQLVEQLGWRGAARRIGISAASIRRALERVEPATRRTTAERGDEG